MTNEELTKKVIEMDEKLIRHGEQIKTAFNQIDDVRMLSDSVHKLATATEVMATAQKTIEKKVDRVAGELEEIKEKPARNWENAVRLVFELALAAVVGWVLVKMGLG